VNTRIAGRDAAADAASDPSARTRILIVDNHRLFAEAIGGALSQRGFELVGVVRTAFDAVETALRVKPDLVLVELGLPDGSGLSAGRAILLEQPTVRVVAVTGSADLGAIRATVEAGFHGFMTKDSSINQLVDALRAVAVGNTVLPDIRGWGERGGEEGAEPAALTSREREILRLLAQGIATREMALRLHIASHTVRSHVQSILSKVGVHSRLKAVAFARRKGLIPAAAVARSYSTGARATRDGATVR
jgi:two-component system, NarL family, nitrate/nitrite response regulator NarL